MDKENLRGLCYWENQDIKELSSWKLNLPLGIQTGKLENIMYRNFRRQSILHKLILQRRVILFLSERQFYVLNAMIMGVKLFSMYLTGQSLFLLLSILNYEYVVGKFYCRRNIPASSRIKSSFSACQQSSQYCTLYLDAQMN